MARGRATLSELPSATRSLFDQVYTFLYASDDLGKLGHNVIGYFGQEFNFEAGVQVNAPFASSGEVVYSSTPSGLAATTLHMGPYDQLPKAHAAVRSWCAEKGNVLEGRNWDVYVVWNDDPAWLATKVFYLLE